MSAKNLNLEIVDSFLLHDGQVAEFGLHKERFQAMVAQCSPTAATEVAAFMAACWQDFPDLGLWFPLLRWSPSTGFSLTIRPAPPLATEVALWLSPQSDPRRYPLLKGPDLAVLADLRIAAQIAGADDAVLIGPDGQLREAAHASLVWWRSGRLCLAPPRIPTLASVSVARLRRLWPQVCYEEIEVEQLAGCRVWALNSLHGLRSVTRLGAVAIDASPHPDLRWWQQRLATKATDESLTDRSL